MNEATRALTDALERAPVMAILRGIRTDEVPAIADALVGAGVGAAEVPLNSPDPWSSIAALAARIGDRVPVGAGTVLDPTDMVRCADAGATFTVSPHFDPAVVDAAGALACIPGVATASEAMAAYRAGCRWIKVFPIDALGVSSLKAWRDVLPGDLRFMAVSGIGVDEVRACLDAGASAVGVGGTLYRAGRDAAEVSERAAALVAAGRPLR